MILRCYLLQLIFSFFSFLGEVFCSDCISSYCHSCFKVFHSMGRKRKHTSTPILEILPDDYYDTVENVTEGAVKFVGFLFLIGICRVLAEQQSVPESSIYCGYIRYCGHTYTKEGTHTVGLFKFFFFFFLYVVVLSKISKI